jgi:hypothetical protein
MTHYLRLSSVFLFLFFFACTAPYKDLQQQSAPTSSVLKFKPVFDKVLYRCVVDGRVVFKRFHLSGLLFFKTMEDGSTRAVFQNEMGFTFFDFEWNADDSFQVNKIIPQLDKVAVIKILEKDMNLLLMKKLDRQTEIVFTSGKEIYHRFDLQKGVAYYIVNNGKLERIENAGKSKVITITLGEKETDTAMPASVFFNHHKANFTIDLKKIESDADE